MDHDEIVRFIRHYEDIESEGRYVYYGRVCVRIYVREVYQVPSKIINPIYVHPA